MVHLNRAVILCLFRASCFVLRASVILNHEARNIPDAKFCIITKALEPVLKPNVSRFSINFERLFDKILPLYSTYCKKFCQKTSQNLWKSEARWILRQALIAIAMIFFLFSCAKPIAKILPNRPTKEFKETLRDASPEFQLGWQDGCEVGMSAGSNAFYRMFYDNNAVDGYRMASSSDYKTAWGNAFWYCFRYDYIKQKRPIWSS